MTLISRLTDALALAAPEGLSPGDVEEASVADTREAAVLVAITDRPEPGVLFTVRHEDLRTHAGQVAFPGGKVDPDDRDPAHTALREAWEEIALDPARVTICGTADRYRTGTNYCITPVVGVIPPDLSLKPDPREVTDWFEAPLAFILDPANHAPRQADYKGRRRNYIEIDWHGRPIWGATAAIIVNLSRRLKWS
ncbi:CoA pyrophosphatase [Sphingomonas sp.]|uniref:CoA pyrophosphatase n=1 Tax=Sphingomonas sp. TaxID=28214 RepID=UPI00286BA2D2|nr:CoA pyrophosphatase [Sphingomonas sp.]